MYRCRICGSRRYIEIISSYKSQFDEIYALNQCKLCSFVSINPLPSVATLKRYYNQDYWQRHESKTDILLTLLYRLRMSSIIKEMKRLVSHEGRILDWGAGDGSLLRLLSKEGFKCWGIDMYSSESDDERIISSTIEDTDFPDDFFDAITCFHVLEHIEKPLESIKKAFNLLKTGGVMVVEVPNIASLGFKIFQKKWYPLDIPVHLNHFSPVAMQRLFRIVDNANIEKVDYFSHRNSPSSLILSLFPSMAPPQMRTKYSGRYPLPLMSFYLVLQILVYPFGMLGSLMKQGEIIRTYVRKIG